MMNAIDCHCHLSDARVFSERASWIKESATAGVRWFALGGVEPTEWRRQIELQREYPQQIVCTFGLHPYFVSKSPRSELELALAELNRVASDCELIGETGLDFRAEVMGDRRKWQEEFFVQQLDLALKLTKPVVLHVVRAHGEAMHFLKSRAVRGLVHAFSGSVQVARSYLEKGLYLSLGTRVLRPEHQKLLRALPLEQILLESDAPDQPPPGQKIHDSRTIILVAEAVARSKNLTVDKVLETTRTNFENLLGRRLV